MNNEKEKLLNEMLKERIEGKISPQEYKEIEFSLKYTDYELLQKVKEEEIQDLNNKINKFNKFNIKEFDIFLNNCQKVCFLKKWDKNTINFYGDKISSLIKAQYKNIMNKDKDIMLRINMFYNLSSELIGYQLKYPIFQKFILIDDYEKYIEY